MDKKTKWVADGEADTPYMRARQEWDKRMGSALVHARNWRLATFCALGAVIFAIAGMVYLGQLPKAVPHIIEVDHLGAAIYRGPVGETGAYAPSDATIKYHLQRFIEDTRSLSSDQAVLKRNWLDAYTLVTSKGGNMLTAFVSAPEHEPFHRAAAGERVSVEVLSAVRVSQDTWQVDWRESSWDSAGNTAAPPALWRGMFHIVLQMPKSEQAMTRNPIGLYVDEFHWDAIQR
jgi:type IV secretory pathway TrbF-like protein